MSPFGFGDIFTLLDLRRQRALRATSSSRSATSSRRTFPASSQPATKRSQTSTSRTTGLCALIEFTDKQLILTRPGPLQIQGSTKPTGKTLGGQGLPLKKRHHVHRAGSRVRLAGAQSASSHPGRRRPSALRRSALTSPRWPCRIPSPSCNRSSCSARHSRVHCPGSPRATSVV